MQWIQHIAQILDAIAWPLVVLIVLLTLHSPIKHALDRLLQVRASSKGIELVLDKLDKEGKLPFGARKELSGLSYHDIWALHSFANASSPVRVKEMKTPQRVAARTLSEAGLLSIEGYDENRTVTITSLGKDILSAADKLL